MNNWYARVSGWCVTRILKQKKLKECNSLYKKTGDNQWTESKNGKSYLIEMKEEEWSFNVTITLNE